MTTSVQTPRSRGDVAAGEGEGGVGGIVADGDSDLGAGGGDQLCPPCPGAAGDGAGIGLGPAAAGQERAAPAPRRRVLRSKSVTSTMLSQRRRIASPSQMGRGTRVAGWRGKWRRPVQVPLHQLRWSSLPMLRMGREVKSAPAACSPGPERPRSHGRGLPEAAPPRRSSQGKWPTRHIFRQRRMDRWRVRPPLYKIARAGFTYSRLYEAAVGSLLALGILLLLVSALGMEGHRRRHVYASGPSIYAGPRCLRSVNRSRCSSPGSNSDGLRRRR